MSEVGPGDVVTINGTSIRLPSRLEPIPRNAQTVTQTAGRARLDAWDYGAGMPNICDAMTWQMDYTFDDEEVLVRDSLAELRVMGGTHALADWVRQPVFYSPASGQQFFYLPRCDAFSAQIADHADQSRWGAIVERRASGTSSWVNLTVTYKTSVASSDVVTTGNAWISNTTTVHDPSGLTVAPFKIGTPLVRGDLIRVRYMPMYRVIVEEILTGPLEPGTTENRMLRFIEVA
jgi:hypothetical protein